MSRTVYQNNFNGWNAQFHPVERTVSSCETHSFILWNAQFHPMERTVSSFETHSFILWNSWFHPVERTVSMPETLRMPVSATSRTHRRQVCSG